MASPHLHSAVSLIMHPCNTLADCEELPLSVHLDDISMRERVLKHMIKEVLSSISEQDEIRTAALCMFWSAHEEIYERVRSASNRNWRLPTVVEGAPSASHWFAIQLKKAYDTKQLTDDSAISKSKKHAEACINAGD